MSLLTVSDKRSRSYQRKFDHEQARALRERGMSYEEIGRLLGASASGVRRVCDPAVRARMEKNSLEWLRDRREPCRGGCGALVWTHHKGGTGLCPACLGAARVADTVREGELLCSSCGRWKPDDDFGLGDAVARRLRRPVCKACENRRQRERRKRISEAPANKHDLGESMSYPSWSDAALVGALWNWAAKTGRTPTFNAWPGSSEGLPGRGAYERRYGSWRKALLAAGFEAPPVQGSGPRPDFLNGLEEVERRVQAGESLVSIGRELGITGQALGRRLRRYRHRRDREVARALDWTS